MANPLYVALIWHYHQPPYWTQGPSGTGAGRYGQPWVRLQGCRDYAGWGELMARYPLIHQTVNFTPCLATQLQDYGAGTALDRHLTLTLTPETQLTLGDKREILETFFQAHPRTQILPYPRYQALYEERQQQGIDWCVTHWPLQQFSDLLAWHNLVWFDPLTVASDLDLQRWLFHCPAFTLGDRQRIISKQRQRLQRIFPLYRGLQWHGQVELIASPYSGPVLPLLADSNIPRQYDPQISLPDPRFCWSEDGAKQLRWGKQIHQGVWGKGSRGVWPPGLALCGETLATIAQLRFEWVCASESLLGVSSQERRGFDHPYYLKTVDGEVMVVCRDRMLSDQIRFDYSRLPPSQAVQALIGALMDRYHYHQEQAHHRPETPSAPPLVVLTLEGDRAWEEYDRQGFDFLSGFFAQGEALSRQGLLQFVTVSEFLDQFPPALPLPQSLDRPLLGTWRTPQESLALGDFRPWIGTPAQNQAWDALIDARQTLANHPEATEDNNPEAWQALLAAECGDWFRGGEDGTFLREHLIRLYRALNEPVPADLYPPTPRSKPPLGCLYPRLGDLQDLTPWQAALEVKSRDLGDRQVIHRVWYGHNPHTLYLRLDFSQDPQDLGADEIHLFWYYPQVPHAYAPAAIASLPDQPPLNYYFHHHCALHLPTGHAWHEEAINAVTWQTRPHRPQWIHHHHTQVLGFPVSFLGPDRYTTLHVLALLAHQGEYLHSLNGDRPWEWPLSPPG